MKNSVFVLFWCDSHHTHNSKRIAGIFEDFDKAFDGAIKFSKSSEESRLSIDDKLLEMLDKYIEDNDISNKSKYIENLIRKDMEERGKEVNRNF